MFKIDETVCFLFFIFICCCMCRCYGSEAGENTTAKKDLSAESYRNDENTVKLPVYAVYLFGFGLVLLILLLIFLVFVLVKTKFLEICKKGASNYGNTETGNVRPTQDVHQKSLKRLNLDRSHSFEFKDKGIQYQTLTENHSSNTLKSTKNDFNSLRTPTKTENPGKLSPRIIKGLGKDMPIILPEQMSQICKEVLTRTTRTTDETTGILSVSVKDLDNIAKETKLEEEIEKKYASSPALDVYDVPPSTLKNDRKSNEKKPDKENYGDQTEIDGGEIYDKPKELNSSNMEDFGIKENVSGDNIYDLPKEVENSNKQDEANEKAILSNNIYDLPKELLDNTINYVKPYFSQTSQDRASKEQKESSSKIDYASLNESSFVTEQNAYEFPKKSQIEGKMYINANEVVSSV